MSESVCSGGIAGIGQLPMLDLPAVSGDRLRSWDFRSRSHLVLLLLSGADSGLQMLAAQRHLASIRAENAELVIVSAHAPEPHLHGPVPSNRIAVDPELAAYRALGAMSGLLLVANKNGTIFWRQDLGLALPDFKEALSWLAYMNIIEPECGCCVPAWPVE
ncbi:MAG: hypothetical protein ACKVVP_20715 [Chloroflexota bacterium]